MIMQPEQMAGVRAKFPRVSHSEHQFTLYFARLDLTESTPNGTRRRRVSVSPLFVSQLIEALQQTWTRTPGRRSQGGVWR